MTEAAPSPLILVVEDDLGLTELIREELEARGWGVLHAPTGREALAVLASRNPDLVLLDFTLPDMTALQLLDQAVLPPFLVTTGSGDERIAVEMMKQGALDYLVKDAHFLGALPGAVSRALHALEVERKLAAAQAELKAADASLRNAQKMESLGRMAGGIAHDFNNLFQGIRGNLEMACMRDLEGPQARAAVEKALKVLEKASILAHKMLDFSGRSFRRSETLDLNRFLGDVLASLRDLPGAASLRFSAGAGLPPVDGDPDQLCQVVIGLVTNAREALGPGKGPIRISTSVLRPEAAGFKAGRWVQPPPLEGPMACLTVEDDGVGMTVEVLDHAFDPFFSTHRPGRGLGLSAALGLLKGHNAGLWVRTAPGEGTTIRILFPPAGAFVEEEAPAAPEPASKRGLLLVDDDEDLQETLGEFLRDTLGYVVIQARDGLEAVEAYRRDQDRIGLILMDATMPRMTGPDAFKVIRSIDPGARSVLCSGFSEEAGSKVAREFGFLEFLKKPFSLSTLKETIVRVVGKPQGSGPMG